MRFLTPARAHPNTRALTHTHTRTQRARDERGGEREREGGRPRRKPFFSYPLVRLFDVRSPPLARQYLGRRDSLVTLWDSSCRPCQTRVYVGVPRRAQALLSVDYLFFKPKERCARAARLPAVVETPLGRRSRDTPRPITGHRCFEADIPLDESVPRSGPGQELVQMASSCVYF